MRGYVSSVRYARKMSPGWLGKCAGHLGKLAFSIFALQLIYSGLDEDGLKREFGNTISNRVVTRAMAPA